MKTMINKNNRYRNVHCLCNICALHICASSTIVFKEKTVRNNCTDTSYFLVGSCTIAWPKIYETKKKLKNILSIIQKCVKCLVIHFYLVERKKFQSKVMIIQSSTLLFTSLKIHLARKYLQFLLCSIAILSVSTPRNCTK